MPAIRLLLESCHDSDYSARRLGVWFADKLDRLIILGDDKKAGQGPPKPAELKVLERWVGKAHERKHSRSRRQFFLQKHQERVDLGGEAFHFHQRSTRKTATPIPTMPPKSTSQGRFPAWY